MTRGDELTVAHLLEFLHARGHKIDFYTLDVADRPMTTKQRAWLESRCSYLRIDHQGRWQRLRGILSGLLQARPLQISYFVNKQQIQAAQQALNDTSYDLAYAYYIRSAEALRLAVGRDIISGPKPKPTSFLALQLSQTLNTERLASTTRRWFERLVFSFESRLIRRYEARIWQHFSRTVLIGEKDLEAIKRACLETGAPPITNFVFGPHGVDVEQFKPRHHIKNRDFVVTMTGVMRYPPNIQAALWFIDEIWPRVKQAIPEATFQLVGRDPVPALCQWDGVNGITVTGTVDDPADYMASATVCVAPIRAAAGLQNKLLEYLAMARPVVATPIANHGIGATHEQELLLAENPQDFADSIVEILRDPDRGKTLGQAGRQFIETNWTWEAHFLRLEQSFYAAADERFEAPSTAASTTHNLRQEAASS
ncbi:MAG: glycosyltransferase family 4 protein [Cyanobacteria bacterium J06638_22]